MVGKPPSAAITRGIPLLLVLFLPSLFASMRGEAAKTHSAGAQTAQVGSGRPISSFAIDDFDGDNRPDLANIQTFQNRAATNNYFIQLQLSGTGRRFIDVEGPAGGLLIEARDVNGDNAVDLVLTTSLLHEPVAILLNDGQGSFLSAKPAEFPDAFHQCGSSWAPTSHKQTKVISAPPQPRGGIRSETQQSFAGREDAGSFLGSASQAVLSFFLTSHSGRAPPVAIPRS
jgi:hypothetical protein